MAVAHFSTHTYGHQAVKSKYLFFKQYCSRPGGSLATSSGRRRGRGTWWRCARCRLAPAASQSSCRCRLCTWRLPFTCAVRTLRSPSNCFTAPLQPQSIRLISTWRARQARLACCTRKVLCPWIAWSGWKSPSLCAVCTLRPTATFPVAPQLPTVDDTVCHSGNGKRPSARHWQHAQRQGWGAAWHAWRAPCYVNLAPCLSQYFYNCRWDGVQGRAAG